MALELNDTLFAGDVAKYMILPATYGLETVKKGVVFVKDGIVKQHTIDRVDFSNPLQSRKSQPTSSTAASTIIDGRTLVPESVMVYAEFEPSLFEDAWLGVQQSQEHPALLAHELPVSAETYIMQIALSRAFEKFELGFWQGSTSYTALDGTAGNGQIKYYDGFLKKMVNDANVQKVASPYPLISTVSDGSHTNILDAMNNLINLAVLNNRALFADPNRYEKLKFLVSIEDEQIYQAASINITFKGQLTQSGESQPWKGFKVVSLAGIPKDTIVFTIATDDVESNLWIGMNSVIDENLQLAKLLPNAETFFLKGLMKFDTQYGYSEKVFLYTTLTAGIFTV
jgi:hypothetical protein